MKRIDFSYFIERYNAGEMSDAEKQWFLKELDENKELRNEVKLRKLTDEVLRKQNIISLRNKLSAIEESRKTDVHVRKILKPAYMKFAAVMTIMAIIGSISMFSGKNLNGNKIIDRYSKAYEFPTVQRSGVSGTSTDFTLALEFYNSHDYKSAATLFNKVLESNPGDMQTVFLNGVTHFELKKFPEAKQSFVRVIDDDKSILFVDAAKWYLALCYLKTDEKEKALKQFEIVRKDGSVYSKYAKKVIKSIK